MYDKFAAKVWSTPLLCLFILSNQRRLVLADVEKWSSSGEKQYQNLWFLLSVKHFRNLFYHRINKGNFAKLLVPIFRLLYKPMESLFIDNSCSIGSGCYIQHGVGSVIIGDLGDNCWINQQVTIGHKNKNGRPLIGNNCFIFSGAKVIGNIKIGNNVTVGANAVVVKNVPSNCTVVGVPAYIVKQNGKRTKKKL
jgi:serine O-acetyltransferase